jgi:DNA segregation ATPase FtsK/SpoIIIE, S-DNA-T family
MLDGSERGELGRLARALSVFFVLGALFLILSRWSFDPYDLGHFAYPAQVPAHNLGGVIGATVTYALLMTFGEAFWCCPVLLLLWSFQLSRGLELSVKRNGAALLLALPVVAMILDNTLVGIPPWAPSFGGCFGMKYGRWLLMQFGPGGTWLFVGMGLVSLLFLLEIKKTWQSFTVPKLPSLAKIKSVLPQKNETPTAIVPLRENAAPSNPLDPDVRPLRRKSTPTLSSDIDMDTEDERIELAPLPIVEAPRPSPSPTTPSVRAPIPVDGEYTCPSLMLLQAPVPGMTDSDDFLEQRARSLETMFERFKVGCRVVGRMSGPSITQYELSIDEGTRVNKVTSLSDNIALTLRAPSVRIVAPIPGRNTIGIEIPNHKKAMVNLRSILDMPECQSRIEQMRLPLILGKDVVGAPLVEDLTKMPHLMVAGTTGSGKSVCINSIIISLIFYHKPEQVRLLMIDPKMVEMSGYEGIPHLMRPVITNMEEAAGVLDWACRTMDERYAMLTRVKVRDIASYNRIKRTKVVEMIGGEEGMEKMEFPMPYIVIIVDEFSDLMMTGAKEIEGYITRLAQKSRAVGIHVILATQRPSVDVITGLIKTNMPSRIAFQVASKIDSRTILDQNGADKLMGRGDMLFMPSGGGALVRAQGVMIDDEEISQVVEFWKAQGEPDYIDNPLVMSAGDSGSSGSIGGGGGEDADEGRSDDFVKAVELVVETGRPSASFIQRQMRAGYNKASRFIELMETMGVVGPPKGAKGREVLWSQADIDQWKKTLP